MKAKKSMNAMEKSINNMEKWINTAEESNTIDKSIKTHGKLENDQEIDDSHRTNKLMKIRNLDKHHWGINENHGTSMQTVKKSMNTMDKSIKPSRNQWKTRKNNKNLWNQ